MSDYNEQKRKHDAIHDLDNRRQVNAGRFIADAQKNLFWCIDHLKQSLIFLQNTELEKGLEIAASLQKHAEELESRFRPHVSAYKNNTQTGRVNLVDRVDDDDQ